MSLLCVKCQAAYGIKQTGVVVIETSGDPPAPIRLWSADLLCCPICAAEVIAHFSMEPIIERHEHGFAERVQIARGSKAYTMHHPAYLATTVQARTVNVRTYANHANL